MKLRYPFLLLIMTAAAGLFTVPSGAADKPEAVAAQLSDSLIVEVNSERPSNIFWDSETMDTHKPILLSWRVASAIQGTSRVQVWWRVLDADGKKVMDGSKRYDIENGAYAAGRQLFTPKLRGAYLWVVRATVKLSGPDLQKSASIPLAIVSRSQSSYPQALSVDTVAPDPLSTDFNRRAGAFVKDDSTAPQFPLPADDVNAAARRRVILYAKSLVKNEAFILRDNIATTPVSRLVSPRDSANALAQNEILAQGSNATGYIVSLNPQQSNNVTFSSDTDDTQLLLPWERASAFAAANNLLSGAHFVKELFPNTPAIYASLFQSGNTSLAAIWSNQDDAGNLKLNLPGALLLDVNGNQVDAAGKDGNLKIPLRHSLYYLQASVNPELMGHALRAAAINGMASVRAQVMPFTQLTDSNDARQIRVRLQNITPHDCSGIVTLDAPSGWKLANASQQFVLKPGQWQIYNFDVTQSRSNYSNDMKVNVRVNNGVTGNWSWTVNPPIATADNWTPKSTFTLDGVLDDWKGATWMQARNDQFDRKAQLAVRWDNQNLYIAAKVAEPRFTARHDVNEDYQFWNSDAIQLGFGWREEAWMQPSDENFRDTDYGILLSPFATGENGSIQGRVLTLWNPTTPFGLVRDRVRWGGAINGADCRINYDPKKKEATYEAVIPLSALGDLNPQARLASTTDPDKPIRFSWVAHTFDGISAQWSQAAGVFPWWGNGGSFLPVEKGYLAAQTFLGFSQRGDLVDASTNAPAISNTAPTSTPPLPPMPTQQQQPRNPIPPMVPAPPQHQVPSLPNPVPIQPIPPNLLPPAPPES